MQVDATAGSVSGVTIALPKANALFYGTVKDGFKSTGAEHQPVFQHGQQQHC